MAPRRAALAGPPLLASLAARVGDDVTPAAGGGLYRVGLTR